MNSTSESLLIRLKSADDYQAWSCFAELYTPLLFHWARKTGLDSEDAADLVQDVLTVVAQRLQSFEYQPSKSFRGWLRTITLNKRREHLRKKSLAVDATTQSELLQVADPNQEESVWDLEYQQALVARGMEMLRKEFVPATWRALREYVVSNRQATDIARETGVSVWTIYAAKSRLMARLRETLDGLLE